MLTNNNVNLEVVKMAKRKASSAARVRALANLRSKGRMGKAKRVEEARKKSRRHEKK
jgi:hypothetical protein